jgi:hypothetical protein
MKFTTRLFLWLGASLALASAFPVGHAPTNLTRRDDGDAYAAVAARDFDPTEDGLYEREFEDFEERDYELEERDLDYELEERDLDYELEERDLDYELEERDLDYYELEERDLDYELEERDLDYYGLEERDLENGLQERQVQAVIKVAEKVAEGIVKVVDLIKDKIQKDKNARSQWTQDFVNRLHAQNPHFNYIICHTDHTAKWDGVRGKDWSHMHQEFPVSFGKTVGYEIYWGRTGTFIRKGDGGYLNWAFYGNVKSRSGDGKTIVWGKP